MKNITLQINYTKLNEKYYSLQNASPLENPTLISVNHRLAKEIGFDIEALESDEFVQFINGEYIANGSIPYATAYAGHQFGYFVPNLGDGRAINLGAINGHHLQTKGSGRTLYSRDGDGRAVLRSSIREYLISEAMHGLGIPTTRALGLIDSTTKVAREKWERGAIVLRASTSWVRFGTIEFFYMGKNKEENLKSILDYVIEESYPHLHEVSNNRYEELYFEIVDRYVELIARWQSVGFMHGVMNTDNMSIAGLTIDYGPFAFMDSFEKARICNHSDYDGRYSYEAQPFIAQWNLLVLAKAFSPVSDINTIEAYANTFIGKYKKRYFELMGQKLGLKDFCEDDKSLITDLLKLLEVNKIDYTQFFWKLSCGVMDERYLDEWYERYTQRVKLDDEIVTFMKKTNPKYVLKNYMLQEAIDKAEQGDYTFVNELLNIAHNPYDEHPAFEHYAKATPKEFTNISCSCSS